MLFVTDIHPSSCSANGGLSLQNWFELKIPRNDRLPTDPTNSETDCSAGNPNTRTNDRLFKRIVKMEKKRKILESREKFDRSLSSPELMNRGSIKSLVEKQLRRSTFSGTQGELERVVKERTAEVYNFLEMLRSASEHDKASVNFNRSSRGGWKLKQETDQLRVMYREGPEGTPFHTLLAEGYVDGPVDSCLCVSWESTLYKNWWPEYNIPTFKILFSSSLQKVCIGEEISLVRVKPPWPVSEREAILHNFELEFFEEDLVLVLMNTISTPEHLDVSTNGITKDGVSEGKDAVKIDLVGGFALQKVSPNRSYFRTIANMDIKLEFVPPALINFISRQLLANGHKLYEKAVVAAAAGEERYREALKGPMYARIREFLYSTSGRKSVEEIFRDDGSTVQEHAKKEILHDTVGQSASSVSTFLYDRKNHPRRDKTCISTEVEHALGILDKAMVVFRDLQSSEMCSVVSRPSTELEVSYMAQEADCQRNGDSSEKVGGSIGGRVIDCIRHSGVQLVSAASELAVHSKESSVLLNPSPTIEGDAVDDETKQRSNNSEMQSSVLAHKSKALDKVSIKANVPHAGGCVPEEQRRHVPKKEKRKYCCVGFLYGYRNARILGKNRQTSV